MIIYFAMKNASAAFLLFVTLAGTFATLLTAGCADNTNSAPAQSASNMNPAATKSDAGGW
jgi:hypothetical protein